MASEWLCGLRLGPTLAVNYTGTTQLTDALLPLLRAGSNPQVSHGP